MMMMEYLVDMHNKCQKWKTVGFVVTQNHLQPHEKMNMVENMEKGSFLELIQLDKYKKEFFNF
jgi:hypothetical protein